MGERDKELDLSIEASAVLDSLVVLTVGLLDKVESEDSERDHVELLSFDGVGEVDAEIVIISEEERVGLHIETVALCV